MNVLVVCTGNICRSPYVAAILQNALPGAEVASAGTAALVRQQPVEPVAEALARLTTSTPPPARQVRSWMVRRADLVLTMTQTQRAAVVHAVPKAGARTFTLKELARTAARFTRPGEELRSTLVDLLDQAALEIARSTRDQDDDLQDPYGGPAEGYTTMMREADEAVRVIVAALGAETAR